MDSNKIKDEQPETKEEEEKVLKSTAIGLSIYNAEYFDEIERSIGITIDDYYQGVTEVVYYDGEILISNWCEGKQFGLYQR